MSQNTVRIVAAILDKDHLTLYKEDGSTIAIKQGDPRVRKIVDFAMPLLIEQQYADVDISSDEPNHYADFEQKSNGLVRFFRVAKTKVAAFFGSKEEPKEESPIEDKKIANAQKAIDEIMSHAIPVTNGHFSEDGLNTQAPIVEGEHGDGDLNTPKEHTSTNSEETMIAVIGDKVIPGIEKIRNQFARANALGSTIGVENFLKRLGAVIESRRHSVDDLLKFMERADMPIADDGSIIIYKVLRRHPNEEGVYVDCHTGKVRQWVGARVCMDESLVDPNRQNECSNGLHVARRGYIREFSGDVCVLGKLAPEDVIAVPAYDANKMRVCAYHILHELPPNLYKLLQVNRAITSETEGGTLLTKMLRGDHIGITDECRITQQRGEGVHYTNFIKKKEVLAAPAQEVVPTVALADDPKIIEMPLDPRQVNEAVARMSRRNQAVQLSDAYQKAPSQETLDELLNFKRSCKVSWKKLGISEPLVLEKALELQKEPKRASVSAAMLPSATNRDRVQAMLPCSTKEQAEAILKIKRTCKKSWSSLGVSPSDLVTILSLAQDK